MINAPEKLKKKHQATKPPVISEELHEILVLLFQ